MNQQRQTYQQGCIQRKKRKRGPDLWLLRYRESGKLRSYVIGTVDQYRTKAEAQRTLASVRVDINNRVEVATFGQLCDRYLKEALPERHSTSSALRSMIKHRIGPDWMNERVSYMAANPLAVEQWIKELQTKPRKKGDQPGQASALIAIASWAASDTTVQLSIDWKKLGIDPARAVMTIPEIKNFQPAGTFNVSDKIAIEKGKGLILIVKEN